jgi:4-carboxymuconolactone decarboxylase
LSVRALFALYSGRHISTHGDTMDENPRFKAGLAVRKAVLGEEYVNQSLANADEFMATIQQFLTENAWGTVWTREGLDRKTRSMLNLAMLTALNRPNELKLHIKGALNNGVTKEEMREIFLQAAVYCGAPAGLDSFKIAQQVFKDEAERQKTGSAPRP